jgi:hypothetical protein
MKKKILSIPAAGDHGLWPWRSSPSCDRNVAPRGRWPRYHGLCPWGSIITILFTLSATLVIGDSLSQVSTKGLFKVEISIAGKSLKVGKNNAEILISGKDGKVVEGARVTALPLIYQHGESTLVRPKVTEKAKGRYAIENIYIEIPGHWVLKITISKGGEEDSVTFDFPEIKRATE